MNDREIREILNHDLQLHKGNSIHEMNVGECRVDMIILPTSHGLFDHNKIYGIEIKSARDVLRRLPKQLKVFSKCFNSVYVVCEQRHTEAINDLIQPYFNVGLIEIRDDRSLTFIRNVNSVELPFKWHSLVRCVDIRNMVTWCGIRPGGRRDKSSLVQLLEEQVPPHKIIELLSNILRERWK